VNFDLSTVADDFAHVLSRAEAAFRDEQAVYGLDSLDERSIQRVLAEGLLERYEVAREVHYPSSASASRLSARKRCDIVLSPKSRPLKLEARPAGLFDPVDVTQPEHALWIEVKCAYQYRELGVRHGGYGPQWRNATIDDIRKMDADERIKEAALVLIVFCETSEILQKDLQLFEDIMVRKEVLAGFRQTREIPILERMGHRLCCVALFPTILKQGDSS
jgi:hypothetical protein